MRALRNARTSSRCCSVWLAEAVLSASSPIISAQSVEPARGPRPVPLAQPRGDLAGLLTVRYPKTRLTDMALPDALRVSLERVVAEQRERDRLREYGLSPMRKLLLVGPPGTGKTDTEGEERPLSKRWADSREIWALTGVQALDEFVKYDADLWR